MPQDAFTIGCLAEELKQELLGAKITKINQPFPDEILLQVYCKQKIRRLIISANPNLARIGFTQQTFPNPAQALSFQMTLRKHAQNGTIEELVQDPFERVLRFKISTKNELSDYEVFYLVCELTGRTSNLLFCSADMTVIAALHTSSLEAERKILPNFPYQPLTQERISPVESDFVRQFAEFEGDVKTFLLKKCKGLAKQTAAEIADFVSERVNLTAKTNAETAESVHLAVLEFFKTPNKPCVLTDGENTADYFAFPYRTCGESWKFCGSISEAIELCCSEKNQHQRFRERAQPLRSIIKGQLSKQEKKLQKIEEKLAECEGAEQYKIFGELVTSNLYRVKKGDSVLVCQNYYDETCPDVEIPLDIRLTPAQNAQRYYKRYNKLKTAKDYAVDQKVECAKLLDYLKTVEYSFEVCTKFEEIEQLTEELREAGFLKKTVQKKKKKEEKITPFLFEYEGYEIAVGKNNLQNDVLSFKTAESGDVWLHAKDYHGCHTVILNNCGGEVPDKVVETAAEIAAFYSKSDRASKTVVDYLDKKFLKKPPASPAGFVTYSNFKSIVVLPNAHAELLKH